MWRSQDGSVVDLTVDSTAGTVTGTFTPGFPCGLASTLTPASRPLVGTVNGNAVAWTLSLAACPSVGTWVGHFQRPARGAALHALHAGRAREPAGRGIDLDRPGRVRPTDGGGDSLAPRRRLLSLRASRAGGDRAPSARDAPSHARRIRGAVPVAVLADRADERRDVAHRPPSPRDRRSACPPPPRAARRPPAGASACSDGTGPGGTRAPARAPPSAVRRARPSGHARPRRRAPTASSRAWPRPRRVSPSPVSTAPRRGPTKPDDRPGLGERLRAPWPPSRRPRRPPPGSRSAGRGCCRRRAARSATAPGTGSTSAAGGFDDPRHGPRQLHAQAVGDGLRQLVGRRCGASRPCARGSPAPAPCVSSKRKARTMCAFS